MLLLVPDAALATATIALFVTTPLWGSFIVSAEHSTHGKLILLGSCSGCLCWPSPRTCLAQLLGANYC
jgi:hypothetical protein